MLFHDVTDIAAAAAAAAVVAEDNSVFWLKAYSRGSETLC
jgi:hypothetical protein